MQIGVASRTNEIDWAWELMDAFEVDAGNGKTVTFRELCGDDLIQVRKACHCDCRCACGAVTVSGMMRANRLLAHGGAVWHVWRTRRGTY